MNGDLLLRAALLIGAVVSFLCEPAWAQDEHACHSAQHFGSVRIPISCSQVAQRQFDGAVAILHSFFYPETVEAFRSKAQAEPSCGMAYSGVAISQLPNPIVPPFSHEALQAGWNATRGGNYY